MCGNGLTGIQTEQAIQVQQLDVLRAGMSLARLAAYYQQISIYLHLFILRHKILVDGLEALAALRFAAVIGALTRMRASSRSF